MGFCKIRQTTTTGDLPVTMPFSRKLGKSSRGVTTVEFTLCVVVSLIMLFGLMDLARFYFVQQSVTHTLRSAGRYAVTGQLKENPEHATNPAVPEYLRRSQSIMKQANKNNPANISISYSNNFFITHSATVNGPFLSGTGGSGDFVKLEFTAPFNFMTPLFEIANATSGEFRQYGYFPVKGELIMRNEFFQTNRYPSDTNYWD